MKVSDKEKKLKCNQRKKDILLEEEQRMTVDFELLSRNETSQEQCSNIFKVLREKQNQLDPMKPSAKMKAK